LIIPIFFFPAAKREGLSLRQVNHGVDALLCFLFLCISFIFSWGMGALTKLFFYKDRPIPMETTTFWKKLNAGSFPSLHTITATIVTMVVFRGTMEFGFSQYIFLLYMIIVVAVALSRIALKKHYPTDVFFGMIYGVVGVFIVLYGGVLFADLLGNLFKGIF
jgi:membrane-associated phospholipid phosphatase